MIFFSQMTSRMDCMLGEVLRLPKRIRELVRCSTHASIDFFFRTQLSIHSISIYPINKPNQGDLLHDQIYPRRNLSNQDLWSCHNPKTFQPRRLIQFVVAASIVQH